ncbi:C40 family peptidase [Pelagibacteraceae bacterium]|nr:C40 family peptidase [Pelagibacteraceae bacterium]
MKKYYSNNFSYTKVFKKMSVNSEMVTQMIYGDSFSIIKKNNKWFKIKIKEDGYIGYIKKKKFTTHIKPSHKVCALFADIYKYPNKQKINKRLTFGSKIKINQNKLNFGKFGNYWIKTDCIKLINYKNKNIFSKIKIFKDIKYCWGGKTYEGLDCSALVQLFFNYNNQYCPRDAKDQIKYFKKSIKLENIKRNDIIYWTGHVAIALSKTKLIHAYGPKKKTLIMGIKKTIKLIQQTANLKVIAVKRI